MMLHVLGPVWWAGAQRADHDASTQGAQCNDSMPYHANRHSMRLARHTHAMPMPCRVMQLGPMLVVHGMPLFTRLMLQGLGGSSGAAGCPEAGPAGERCATCACVYEGPPLVRTEVGSWLAAQKQDGWRAGQRAA